MVITCDSKTTSRWHRVYCLPWPTHRDTPAAQDVQSTNSILCPVYNSSIEDGEEGEKAKFGFNANGYAGTKSLGLSKTQASERRNQAKRL